MSYNVQGLVEEIMYCNEEGCGEPDATFCMGHVNRMFVHECSRACNCPSNCGNRVVQEGSRVHIQVFWTGNKGWGLRPLQFVPKGTFVFEYVGEIVTEGEMMARRMKGSLGKSEAYTLELNAAWREMEPNGDDMTFYMDSTAFSNSTRFLNHSYFTKNQSHFFMCLLYD
jgi:SET domain-containing protein